MGKTTIETEQYTYTGNWQEGNVIQQRLEGPCGDGVVDYVNGDRFEGSFHLSYSSIWSKAFTADGKYCFADGSVIEHAWLDNTNASMVLSSVFLIHHANGPDTITPFIAHERNGLELVLAEKPYAIEWKDGEKLQELGVDFYTFDENDQGCPALTITLADESVVTQYGGKVYKNVPYGSNIFDPTVTGSIRYPDGIIINYWGYALKQLKPYDGNITIHNPDGTIRKERWSKGLMEIKETVLPDPMNKDSMMPAEVDYSKGRVVYGTPSVRYFWYYDGELKDGRPHGHGVLHMKDYRYEGEFKDGLCHGEGTYVNPVINLVMQGQWVEGEFQDPNAPATPITLHVHYKENCNSLDKDIIAKTGFLLIIPIFELVRIEHVEKERITLMYLDDVHYLTPGQTVSFHRSLIDFGEDDEDEVNYLNYDMDITWKEL